VRGSLVRRVRHWVANRGWKGFFAEVLRRLGLALHRREPEVGRAVAEEGVHPFDRRHDVKTSGLIWGERLRSGHKEDYWATGYYGIAPSAFWRAMDKLSLEWPRYTFVDVGCGKGRALMLALRYPFRRVLGIELSPELARAAKENLRRFEAKWRMDVPVDAVAGNAMRLELPSGPPVLYLYHPFAAPVMKKFLAHLEASFQDEQREVYLLYTNPELDGLLRASPLFVKLWDECFPMDEEDVAADLFRSQYERMVAYKSRQARPSGNSERK
jgi:SAM-dependent methyltransferase